MTKHHRYDFYEIIFLSDYIIMKEKINIAHFIKTNTNKMKNSFRLFKN